MGKNKQRKFTRWREFLSTLIFPKVFQTPSIRISEKRFDLRLSFCPFSNNSQRLPTKVGLYNYYSSNMERSKENNTIIFRMMQDVGLGNDTEICQYLRLDYLQALLKTGKYYVRKKKYFTDKQEGSIPPKLIFSEFTIPGGKLTHEQESRSQERNKSINHYEQESSLLLTSCWTERTSENALMWDRMGESHQACIKTTVGNFVSAFIELKYHIWCGKMLYGPIYKAIMSDDIIWYKEPYFSDEREVRFYFSTGLQNIQPDSTPNDHQFFPVNTQTLINEIVLSPYIERNAAEVLKDTIKNTYEIPTSLSKIEIR